MPGLQPIPLNITGEEWKDAKPQLLRALNYLIKDMYDWIGRIQGVESASEPLGLAIEPTIGDGVISQAKLKTTTGGVRTVSTSLANLTLPGGEYGFYPQVATSTTGYYVTAQIVSALNTSGFYVSNIAMAISTGGAAYAQQRYVQASGEVHWLFILRTKFDEMIDGKDVDGKPLSYLRPKGTMISMWQAPDHPCFGNSGDPDKMPHPFLSFDSLTQEVLSVTLAPAEVKTMRARNPGKDLLQIIAEKYAIDEKAGADWPKQPVTVGLPPDWDEAWLERTPVKPVKKVIPKPKGIKIAGLKRR